MNALVYAIGIPCGLLAIQVCVMFYLAVKVGDLADLVDEIAQTFAALVEREISEATEEQRSEDA